jgi:hypothetical protein
MKKIIMIITILLPSFTMAITNAERHWDRVKLKNPSPIGGSLSEMLRIAIEGLMKLAIPLLVLGVIYSGFLLIKAQGNETELKKARSAVLWVLVGAAIILSASLILNVLEDSVTDFVDNSTVCVPSKIITI